VEETQGRVEVKFSLEEMKGQVEDMTNKIEVLEI